MGLMHYATDTPQAFVGNVRGAIQGLGKGGITNGFSNAVRRFTNEISTVGQDLNLRR